MSDKILGYAIAVADDAIEINYEFRWNIVNTIGIGYEFAGIECRRVIDAMMRLKRSHFLYGIAPGCVDRDDFDPIPKLLLQFLVPRRLPNAIRTPGIPEDDIHWLLAAKF